MKFFDQRERVLTATWTTHQGVVRGSSDLPETWTRALERVGRDLHVRQYGGSVNRIEWVGEYEPETGFVLILSDVTASGRGPGGLGASGSAARVDDSEDEIAVSIADLVQNEVADTGIAWPWGDTGGFMSSVLIDSTAMWSGRNRHRTRIGDL